MVSYSSTVLILLLYIRHYSKTPNVTFQQHLIFLINITPEVNLIPALYYAPEYTLYLHDVRTWTHYTITWALCIQECVPRPFVVPSDLKMEP